MASKAIYVGNLPQDFRDDEVYKMFDKYGSIERHEVKRSSNNQCFAFIEFRDARSAEDAIRGHSGFEFVRGPPACPSQISPTPTLACAHTTPVLPPLSHRTLLSLSLSLSL